MTSSITAAFTPFVVVLPCALEKSTRVYRCKREPTLWRLQHMVGGYIERVPHWEDFDGIPCNAWVNEEGKLYRLPINIGATLMWYAKMSTRMQDVLVGNVILTVGFPDKEELND